MGDSHRTITETPDPRPEPKPAKTGSIKEWVQGDSGGKGKGK